MNREEIQELHNHFKTTFPHLNSGGCGMFAYAFVSLVGGKVLALDTRPSLDQKEIEKALSGEMSGSYLSFQHCVVKYQDMILDGHQFIKVEGKKFTYEIGGKEYKSRLHTELNKAEILCCAVEGSWNPVFANQFDTNLHGVAVMLEEIRNILY